MTLQVQQVNYKLQPLLYSVKLFWFRLDNALLTKKIHFQLHARNASEPHHCQMSDCKTINGEQSQLSILQFAHHQKSLAHP